MHKATNTDTLDEIFSENFYWQLGENGEKLIHLDRWKAKSAINTLRISDLEDVLKEIESAQWSSSKAVKGSIMWSQEIGHKKALEKVTALLEAKIGKLK